MGAEYQETNIGFGRTVEEAFGQVYEEACYYSGHGGYTGTMAEKPGASLVGVLPPRMDSERFSQLANNYAEFTGLGWRKSGTWTSFKTVDCPEHIAVYTAWKNSKPGRDASQSAWSAYYETRPNTDTCSNRCRMFDGQYTKSTTHRTTPIPKFLREDKGFELMLKRFVEIAQGDKWENAAAVQLNQQERTKYIKGVRGLKRGTQVYMFEGYCSS